MNNLPSLPPGLRYAESEYEESGFKAIAGIIPRRWAGDPGIVRECLVYMNLKRQKIRRHRLLVGDEEEAPPDIDIVDEDELFRRLIGGA